jgi:hypothetical protein
MAGKRSIVDDPPYYNFFGVVVDQLHFLKKPMQSPIQIALDA